MRISVRADVKALERRLNVIQRDQIPFATSRALNDVAFDVRAAWVRLWQFSVNVRRASFIRAALRVEKSTKRRLTATVFDRLGRSLLVTLAKGRRVRPQSAPHLKVPTRNVLTPTGRISRRKLGDVFTGDPLGKGRQGVWERTRLGELRLLYTLEPHVDVGRHWPIEAKAEQIVRRNFATALRLRLAQALRTARR